MIVEYDPCLHGPKSCVCSELELELDFIEADIGKVRSEIAEERGVRLRLVVHAWLSTVLDRKVEM